MCIRDRSGLASGRLPQATEVWLSPGASTLFCTPARGLADVTLPTLNPDDAVATAEPTTRVDTARVAPVTPNRAILWNELMSCLQRMPGRAARTGQANPPRLARQWIGSEHHMNASRRPGPLSFFIYKSRLGRPRALDAKRWRV